MSRDNLVTGLVAAVPLLLFAAYWMYRRSTVARLREPWPDNPSARPVVTQRSRRMALLPIVIVLGIFTIVRAVIEH
jgi:hypothetical protein